MGLSEEWFGDGGDGDDGEEGEGDETEAGAGEVFADVEAYGGADEDGGDQHVYLSHGGGDAAAKSKKQQGELEWCEEHGYGHGGDA